MGINFGFKFKLKAEDSLKRAQDLLISAKKVGSLQDPQLGFNYFCQAIELIKQTIDTAEKKSDLYSASKAKSLLCALIIGNKASFYHSPGNEHIALAQLDIKSIAKLITLEQKHFERWLNEQTEDYTEQKPWMGLNP